MAITNIQDYRGYCIADSSNTCIILQTHIAVFGCGALQARIWRAGLSDNSGNKNSPIIRTINEL